MRFHRYIPVADLSKQERAQIAGMARALQRQGIEPTVLLMPSSAGDAWRRRQAKARAHKLAEAAHRRQRRAQR